MKYEDALQLWAAEKLAARYSDKRLNYTPNIGSIVVEFDFNEGYSCCGGSDPDCYCSFAEPPSASIVIRDGHRTVEIESWQFDFASILGEIVAAGDGHLTGSTE